MESVDRFFNFQNPEALYSASSELWKDSLSFQEQLELNLHSTIEPQESYENSSGKAKGLPRSEVFVQIERDDECKETGIAHSARTVCFQRNSGLYPGSVCTRVARLCWKGAGSQQEAKLLQLATQNLNATALTKFQTWASSLKRRGRAWIHLRDFLLSDTEFGTIFLNIVVLVLSDVRFQDIFDGWVRNNRQFTTKTRRFLLKHEHRRYFADKFIDLLESLQDSP